MTRREEDGNPRRRARPRTALGSGHDARNAVAAPSRLHALTRVDSAFAGRAYAAYGGIYIGASLWIVEGQAPTRTDAIGAALAIVGALVISALPRGALNEICSGVGRTSVHKHQFSAAGPNTPQRQCAARVFPAQEWSI